MTLNVSNFRDVPACATLNRTCYSRRSNNHPYTSYYGTEPSPYADPRSDIYYTSTLTRHPRHSSSTSRGFPPEQEQKIYDTPAPPPGYHHQSLSSGGGGSGHGTSGSSSGGMRSYGVGVGGMGGVVPGIGTTGGMSGPPSGQSGSILRLDEPRIYSSSALQLGSTNVSASSLQRSSSPQHHNHFIDRSISLIRLDNSGNVAVGAGSTTSTTSNSTVGGGGGGGNSSGMTDSGVGSSVTLSSGGVQPRFV